MDPYKLRLSWLAFPVSKNMRHSVSAILMSSMVRFGVCRGNTIEHGMELVKLFKK